MNVDLKRDWPIIAAAVVGLIALVLLTRRQGGVQPIVVGGGTPAGTEAAIQAQTAISTAQIQAQSASFQTLVQGLTAVKVREAEASAAIETARLTAAAQRQQAELGFLGSIFSGIFGLFSWETTDAAEKYRAAVNARRLPGHSFVPGPSQRLLTARVVA